MTAAGPDPESPAGNPYYSEKLNLNVAQLLLEYLKLEGVAKLFGIPGAAVIDLMYELRDQHDHFDYVICRHETGAAYIAHGYSVVADGLGVVLTTAGPAATNALTGALNGQASGASLLVITGEVAQQYFGRGYLQAGFDARLEVDAIYRNAVQSSALISNQSNFATLFEQALRDARSLPPRVAHVSLPADVAAECVQSPGLTDAHGNNRVLVPRSPAQYRTRPSGTDLAKVEPAFADLAAAQRPLLFVGNGCRRALASPQRLRAFTALVEKFAFPVMTTLDAKGIFPETHELSLRNYGMAACAWPERYMHPPQDPPFDALMVLGSSLGELATSVAATDPYSQNLLPSRHLIQVDLDQSVIGRNFPITLGIVAEAGATIDALCRLGGERPAPAGADRRKALIGTIKRDPQSAFYNPAWRASDAAPVNPAALIRVVNEELKRGHVFVDAGNCIGWSLNNMVVDPPLYFHSAQNMGPMGFAVGAVIGGKIAAPDLPCLAIVGDGDFMMHGAELSTAAQNRVGAVWVVLNDNDLAMVSQGMAALFPPPEPWRDYYALGAPDLAGFGASLGAHATRIAADQGAPAFRHELRLALRRADADQRPQVIVVDIDPAPAPPYGWPKLGPPKCGPQQ